MPTSTAIISTVIEYWPIVVGTSVFTLVLAAWTAHNELRYRRWLFRLLDAYDLHGQPVTVYAQDREFLERARREQRLEVVMELPGCWKVARPRLGPLPRGK